ncbi:hypothetical protein GCM10007148_13600 [Parvularcula lutaonensis]|nr:hypothetical protein GCM10007148_13600 [Parvularcula lutaonensis]
MDPARGGDWSGWRVAKVGTSGWLPRLIAAGYSVSVVMLAMATVKRKDLPSYLAFPF